MSSRLILFDITREIFNQIELLILNAMQAKFSYAGVVILCNLLLFL